MRANNILGLTAAAVSLTFVLGAPSALAVGQIYNPVAGSGTKYYPTSEVPNPGPLSTRANPVVDYRQGVVALKAGKYRDAIASFDRALILAPNDSNTWTMLGFSYEGVGDLIRAHDAYDKAVGFNAGNIAARQRRGVTAAKLGQADQAQADLAELQKRAVACGPRCPGAGKLKSAIAAVADALAQGPAPAKG